MDTPTSLLEITIAGRKITDLLSGDPYTNTAAAYELLRLSHRFFYYPPVTRDQSFYQLIEVALKKRYLAFQTGIAPEGQQDEEVKDISLLQALFFFRELGKEAQNITEAIESIWQFLERKQELDAKSFDGFWMLREEAEKGNQVAKTALELLREAYLERVE